MTWTVDIENILEKVRINCVNLSEYHRNRYYHYKGYGKYFRVPIIILASVNSTASVGLQPVLSQGVISGITCLIGMVMGIMGAIELYLGIQTSVELELKQSKDYYKLAIDIFKVLAVERDARVDDPKDYLNEKYSIYSKLCETSDLLDRKLKIDMLTEIPKNLKDETISRNVGLSLQLPNFYNKNDSSFPNENINPLENSNLVENSNNITFTDIILDGSSNV